MATLVEPRYLHHAVGICGNTAARRAVTKFWAFATRVGSTTHRSANIAGEKNHHSDFWACFLLCLLGNPLVPTSVSAFPTKRLSAGQSVEIKIGPPSKNPAKV
jgi:hypothetical protein